MATTVTAPVSNSFALAQKYVPLLDEVYKRESLTSMFDASQVDWTGVDTVKVYTLSALGLGDYSKSNGFVPGDLTGAWESFQVQQDRGRSYMIDYMDNEASMSLIVGNALNEIERTQIIPEVDAYRFAKWAGTANIDGATATLSASDDIPDLIATAEASMDDNEVPYEGRILFVNPTVYKYLKGDITRRIVNSENNVNMNELADKIKDFAKFFDDMPIYRVPSARFKSAITLAQPSDHDDAGGYTANGADINFMIVHPSALFNVIRHYVPRIFSPEQNTEADAYLIQPRYVHDTFVFPKKVKGIYCHKAQGTSA